MQPVLSTCASCGVWMCIAVQEIDTFSEHLALFVLDWPPKLMWRFTINLWRYCGTWCHKLPIKLPNDFVNEFISDNWVSSLITFFMHISTPILKLSAPFSHTTVTYNIITVYKTQSTMNLSCALSFCMKKTNHSKYLAAGGSGVDSVHVSSAITLTLLSENAWQLVFRDNKLCLLLLSLWFGAMPMHFFYQPIGGWFWNSPRISRLFFNVLIHTF
jgi:hypothetical protein